MTPHDQELLERQLHGIDGRPPEGVFMLAMAAVFFTGMAVGGIPLRLYRSAAAADRGKRHRHPLGSAGLADHALKLVASTGRQRRRPITVLANYCSGSVVKNSG